MNRRRFRTAPAILVVALAACGGGGSKAKDANDTKSGDWFSKLVDEQTDSEIRMRPNDFAADSFAGPLVAVAEKQASAKVDNPNAAALITVLEKSDVVVLAIRKTQPTDAVLVIGGVPSDTNPDGLKNPSGEAVFKKAEPAGGVEEWQLANGSAQDQAGRLAVVGGSTWVFGLGPAVARMNEAFSEGTPTAYAPDVAGGGKGLLDIAIAGDTLAIVTSDPEIPLPPPITANLKHVTFAFDGGSTPGIHAKLTYADESSAGKADQLVNAMVAKAPMLKMIGDLKVGHSGSDLTADLPVSEGVRDLVVASAGGGGISTDATPTESSPQEIKPPKKKKKKGH